MHTLINQFCQVVRDAQIHTNIHTHTQISLHLFLWAAFSLSLLPWPQKKHYLSLIHSFRRKGGPPLSRAFCNLSGFQFKHINLLYLMRVSNVQFWEGDNGELIFKYFVYVLYALLVDLLTLTFICERAIWAWMWHYTYVCVFVLSIVNFFYQSQIRN